VIRRNARILLAVAIAAGLAPACRRSSDDDLPPPIPLPAEPRPQPESPAIRPPQQNPQADPEPPRAPPQPTATATATATASASADPDAVPTVTPYNIPYPLPIPTSVPGLPAIPGLPGIPGFGTPAPDPQGEARVVVYGTRTCPACAKLKDDLRARRVPFDFIDLENPLELNSPLGRGAADVPAKMRHGIPVSRITQKSGRIVWVQGADAPKVERAYRG
jgi:hypothetical protein